MKEISKCEDLLDAPHEELRTGNQGVKNQRAVNQPLSYAIYLITNNYPEEQGSPRCLAHAREFSLESKLAQTDATQAEFAVVCPCSSTAKTSIVLSRGELRFFLRFVDQT